jgi:3-phenylpropionate/cinnamic acid dioxygenase small subunit
MAGRDADVSENTVQRVADELEIRNLVARLAQLADDGDLDDYIQLFTHDAVWDGGTILGTKQGHAELLAAARERRASGAAGPGTNSRHVITTSVVDVAGDRATGRAVFHYYVKTDGAPELALMGVYDDEFVRTDRGWRLARRKITGARQPETS